MSENEGNKMTEEQKTKCAAIIHTATAASGGASFFTAQIPLADSAIILPAQMTMIVGLAGIFGIRMDKSLSLLIMKRCIR